MLHLPCMAAAAIALRKSNLAMTGTAIFPGKKVDHAVFFTTALYPDKNIRMAEFATIPDSMLLVGEYNFRNPVHFGTYGEILLVCHGRSPGGDPFNVIDQLEQTTLFSQFPVDTVPPPLLRHCIGKGTKGSFTLFPACLFFQGNLILAVAIKAALHLLLGELVTASSKKLLFSKRCPAVMAGATVITFHIIGSPDPPFIRLHGKPYVDMTDSAGKAPAMNPVLKNHRIHPRLQ